MMMGEWGARWVRSRLEPEDLDVTLLMWDMHRTVRPEHFPAHRVVVGFEFSDVPRNKRRWWLVSEGDAADLCVTDPGYDVDLLVLADLRTMTAIWTGDVSLHAALASGALEAHGPADLRRRLSAWLGLSAFAPIKDMRPAPARCLSGRHSASVREHDACRYGGLALTSGHLPAREAAPQVASQRSCRSRIALSPWSRPRAFQTQGDAVEDEELVLDLVEPSSQPIEPRAGLGVLPIELVVEPA